MLKGKQQPAYTKQASILDSDMEEILELSDWQFKYNYYTKGSNGRKYKKRQLM